MTPKATLVWGIIEFDFRDLNFFTSVLYYLLRVVAIPLCDSVVSKKVVEKASRLVFQTINSENSQRERQCITYTESTKVVTAFLGMVDNLVPLDRRSEVSCFRIMPSRAPKSSA